MACRKQKSGSPKDKRLICNICRYTCRIVLIYVLGFWSYFLTFIGFMSCSPSLSYLPRGRVVSAIRSCVTENKKIKKKNPPDQIFLLSKIDSLY